MTLSDTINSMSGLLYALRHQNLDGMSNQQRRREMRHLSFGMGLLSVAIAEKSMGAATIALGTTIKPASKLSEAGKKTAFRKTGLDWGHLVAGRLAAACLVTMMSLGTLYATPSKADVEDTPRVEMAQSAAPAPKLPIFRI